MSGAEVPPGQVQGDHVTERVVTFVFLEAGLHRLEAFKLLGRETILTLVVERDDSLLSELAEIDENLMRNDLTPLQSGEHLVRRNEVLEKLKQRAKPEHGALLRDTPSATVAGGPKTTTRGIAGDMGVSERTAQNYSRIVRGLSPETKEAVRGTDLESSTTELLELARSCRPHLSHAGLDGGSSITLTIVCTPPERRFYKERLGAMTFFLAGVTLVNVTV